MKLVFSLFGAVVALWPLFVHAAETIKQPLSYSLREYAMILGTSLLGGLVSWYAKVRRGEVSVYKISQLVGELCTSAFAGLIAFWICEWAGMAPLLTAALVAISGHAGATAIQWFERFAESKLTTGSGPK